MNIKITIVRQDDGPILVWYIYTLLMMVAAYVYTALVLMGYVGPPL